MANNNLNPVTIYFNCLTQAAEWADAHPEVALTIWGETQTGKFRGSFVLRKKYEQVAAAEAEAVPTV